MGYLRLRIPMKIEEPETDRVTSVLQIRPINGHSTPVIVRCRGCGAVAKANRKALGGKPLERCRECK